MKASKNVESFFCKKLPTGVYMLVFNLTEKWMPYHAYDDYTFWFGLEKDLDDNAETDEIHENFLEWESNLHEVPAFLPKIDGIWLRSSMQDDDQVTFFYIPHYREWLKSGAIENISF